MNNSSVCIWYVDGKRCRRKAVWRVDGYDVCDRCRNEDTLLARFKVAIRLQQ